MKYGIDWLLLLLPLLLVIGVALYTQRYMKSVADFLSGRRLAGRYLLAVARAANKAWERSSLWRPSK